MGPVGTKLRRNVHWMVLLQDWGFMGNIQQQQQNKPEKQNKNKRPMNSSFLWHRMGNLPLIICQEYNVTQYIEVTYHEKDWGKVVPRSVLICHTGKKI